MHGNNKHTGNKQKDVATQLDRWIDIVYAQTYMLQG